MNHQTTIIQWGFSVLAAIAIAPSSHAATINFSAHHPDDNGIVTSANLSGPSGVAAGVETWNLNNFNDGAAQSGLVDATGSATGVGVTFDGLGGPDDWGYNSPLKLVWRSGRGFYNGPGNSASFTINGLDNSTLYDLYIASAHSNGTTVGDWTTANPNATAPSLVINNTGNEGNGSTWVAGVNYVFFHNLQPIGGNITMTEHVNNVINGADGRVGMNGFQLISVPEPSSSLIVGFAALGLIRRRRA
jgi:hypothetical protein